MSLRLRKDWWRSIWMKQTKMKHEQGVNMGAMLNQQGRKRRGQSGAVMPQPIQGTWRQLSVAVSSAMLALSAQAQMGLAGAPIPEDAAQRTQRYYDQQLVQPESAPSVPLEQPPAPPVQKLSQADVRFVLNAVEFSPSEFLSPAQLQQAVAPFVGKEVDGQGLEDMLEAINQLYLDRQITTSKAILAPQSIEGGRLQVELVEGRLGRLNIQGLQRTKDSFVRNRLHQKEGEVVDTNRLRQDILFLNRTTNLQVKALLEPGEKRGLTDVLLNVEEPDRVNMDVYMDNNGSESTGKWRVGANVHARSLLGFDDDFSATLNHSKGSNDGVIAYSLVPFRYGGRIGVSYSRSQIDIIDGPFRDLSITGHSNVWGMNYSQPLWADANWMVSALGNLSHGRSSTKIGGFKVSEVTTRRAGAGVSLQHLAVGQAWGVTQMVNNLRMKESMGSADAATIFPGTAYIVQNLPWAAWQFRGNMGWQWSNSLDLSSANLFQIGGLGSVRGYKNGVIAGPRGYYTSLELHKVFSEAWDVFGFYDRGTVKSAYPGSKTISSVGVGVNYQWRGKVSVSADVGRPLKKVTPDQSSVKADLRIAYRW